MNPSRNIVNRASGVLEQLNTREKFLVLLMIVVFSAMGIFIGMRSFLGSIRDAEEEIERYERAIQMLSMQQADFAERMEAAEELQQRLENNDIQLRTFIERYCIENSVDRPSTYSDEQVVQLVDQNVVEVEIQATINQVDPAALGELLEAMATSGELIVLEAIEIQPSRGASDRFRVDLKVTTYRPIEDDS